MKHTHRKFVKIGFLFAGLSVVLGAFGSHLLKKYLDEPALNTFEIGVRYQFMHALALIMLGLNHRRFNESRLSAALWLMVIGVIIFSGSLYLLSTRSIWGSDEFKFIGAITPLGGVSFILAWFILFFAGFSSKEKYSAESEDITENKSTKRHRSEKSKTHNED
ncbi:MAG: DUF423 domain-containing protein [Bacteroidia bacterium]|nr:DUF423 domain-containing protein [Bacteroidia bacterium]